VGEGRERHRRRIDRSYALAAREVTVAEFLRFRKDHQYHKPHAPTADCPMNVVSWYDAAAYCNWLSKEEGIPEEQWCYLRNAKGEYAAGMKVAGYLKRTGYRLPTEAEWEYACRAGSETGWSHGDAEDLLAKYAWYAANSSSLTHPVGSLRPNDLGLFDMHGHAWEWCQDRYTAWPPAAGERAMEDKEDIEDISDRNGRVLRGGAFNVVAGIARSAFRSDFGPALRVGLIGFRPARTFR
jgi:formylglycine-generating enzyme required for sulfatase activity